MFSMIIFRYRWLILLAVISVVSLVAAWAHGYYRGVSANARDALVALQQTRQTEQRFAAASAAIDARHAAARAELAATHQTISREIRTYAKTHATNTAVACRLDLDWLRLHDAAALSTAPAPAGSINDSTPATADPAAALAVVADNYANYAEVAAQLTALQDWVRAAQAGQAAGEDFF